MIKLNIQENRKQDSIIFECLKEDIKDEMKNNDRYNYINQTLTKLHFIFFISNIAYIIFKSCRLPIINMGGMFLNDININLLKGNWYVSMMLTCVYLYLLEGRTYGVQKVICYLLWLV